MLFDIYDKKIMHCSWWVKKEFYTENSQITFKNPCQTEFINFFSENLNLFPYVWSFIFYREHLTKKLKRKKRGPNYCWAGFYVFLQWLPIYVHTHMFIYKKFHPKKNVYIWKSCMPVEISKSPTGGEVICLRN